MFGRHIPMASNNLMVTPIIRLAGTMSKISISEEFSSDDFHINGLPNSEWIQQEIAKGRRIRAIFVP